MSDELAVDREFDRLIGVDRQFDEIAGGKLHELVNGDAQAVKLDHTLQGKVAFDENGDLQDKVISVFQIKKDASKPLEDPDAQYRYQGNGPASV